MAHHIVASGHRLADPSRRILAQYGFDLNDAVNGVFMDPVVHSHIHRKEYFRWIYMELLGAESAEDVRFILDSIRQRLMELNEAARGRSKDEVANLVSEFLQKQIQGSPIGP